MKISVKKKIDRKWHLVSLEEIQGMSLIKAMLLSEHDMVAALFNDEEDPIAFVITNPDDGDKLKGKGAVIPAIMLMELLGSEAQPPIIQRYFPGSKLLEMSHEHDE